MAFPALTEPMTSILLVTTAFPPAPEVGALRCAKLATALRSQGWKSVVLTVGEGAYTAPRDRYGRQARPLPYPPAEGIEVIRVPAFNPIAVAGRIRQRGQEELKDDRDSKTEVSARHYRNWRGSLARFVTKAMVPDEYAFWVRRAVKAAVERAKHDRMKIVLATFPTAGALVAGARIAEQLKIPFVADYRDPWEYYGPGYQAGPLRAHIEIAVRSRVIQRASAAIAVTEDVLERNLRGLEVNHLRTAVLPQAWDTDEACVYAGVQPKSRADGILRIVHAGTVYPETSDPEPFLSAVRSLLDAGTLQKERIRLLFLGQVLADIESMAERYGLMDVVQIEGLVERNEALQVLSEADILLILRHAGDDAFLSGKIWDYLTVARPVFAVVSKKAPIAKLITEARCGVVAQAADVGDIRAGLTDIVEQVARPHGPYDPDRPRLEGMSTRAIGTRLAALLDEILS